jgi:TolB-like protein/class 3 adenylate cyclase/thioredoxin-like negative regulator of GroEL
MAADPNRDVQLEIAHVLFTDIVGYSKLLSDEQRELFQVFNEIVRNTRQFQAAEAAGKLVRLATGDGIALAFFTSPDAPVRCAREISRKLREHPQLRLRMGINSGPVDEVSDVNDRRNVTGAGINMAQRVMDCGDAGHILLSKRVADDLAQYSEWRPHLHELGDVEVKHGVRVHVVNLHNEDFGNPEVPTKIKRAEQERATASAQAAKLKRRRIIIVTSAALLLLLSVALGTWAWQRRAALTSAYKIGAAGIVEKSIAILPFESFAEDKENAYFADGVQDDILTDLAKVADLKVISRRSVAQYRGSTKDVREIGQALQVAHVLEGTVRKIGDTVRVTAQLIDTRTEAQTWAEKYERKVADVFAIQSDISQAIVAQLKAALSPNEKASIEERPTRDQEAYDLYLRARALVYEYGVMHKVGQEDLGKAVTLLESGIARDPKFTLAYCLLSEAQLSLYAAEYWNKERLPKAKEALDNALRVSPNSAQAHLALAQYLYRAPRDAEGAEKELAIAATSLPGEVEVFNLRAAIEEQRGRWTKALHDREKASELDPRDQETAGNLIGLYISIRRYSDAEKLCDRMIASIPQQLTGPYWRYKSGIALAHGDTKAAMAALDANPNRNAGLVGLNSLVANVLVMERQYAKAAEILLSVEEVARSHHVLPKGGSQGYSRGHILEQLGRIARAQGQIETARGYFESARPEFEEWLAKNPEELSEWEGKARAYIAEIDAALGRKEDALREADHALELWPLSRNATVTPDIAQILAVARLWAGERDTALQLLAQFARVPYGPTAGDLKLNPVWDEIRADPRFNKIIADAAEAVKLD